MKRMLTLSIFQFNSYTGTKKGFNIYMIHIIPNKKILVNVSRTFNQFWNTNNYCMLVLWLTYWLLFHVWKWKEDMWNIFCK